MKIAIVLGTRPEIIKMASVMDEIEKRGHQLLLIHTGQHYDKEMSENFFIDLKLPTPNYNIHVGSGSHGKQTGKMMEGIEEVLLDEKPDILLVQGDTNAVLAGTLVASKLHIPVGHVEAGLRCLLQTYVPNYTLFQLKSLQLTLLWKEFQEKEYSLLEIL